MKKTQRYLRPRCFGSYKPALCFAKALVGDQRRARSHREDGPPAPGSMHRVILGVFRKHGLKTGLILDPTNLVPMETIFAPTMFCCVLFILCE